MPEFGLVKVTLTHSSGVARDAASNSFSVIADDLGAQMSDIHDAIESFYNDVPAGGLLALKDLLSEELDNNADACVMDMYDVTGHLDGSPHGSPIGGRLWTLADPAAAPDPLPSEVALAITLEAVGRDVAAVEAPDDGDPGSEVNRPKQRRTGRLYLGPLNDNAGSTVDGIARPGENLIDTANLACQALQDAFNGIVSGDVEWAVWSRADAVMRVINNVSIDNAWDTQRRRGASPTTRQRVNV